MFKRLALAASAFALLAAGTAYANEHRGGPGVDLWSNVQGVQKYYVANCADYLAHPEDQHAAVIAFMSRYTTGGEHNPQYKDRMPAGNSVGPQVGTVDAACAAHPHLLFTHLLDNLPSDRIG